MRVLNYEKDVNGFLQPTSTLTMKGGKEFWLGNPMSELAEAMDEGKPFTAHAVKGMQPVEVIVNPPHVATIEVMKP